MDSAAVAHGTGHGRLSRLDQDHPPGAASAGLSLETPQVRLGPARSGLHRKKAAVIVQAQAMLAAGGEVWVGDETAVREFPPLRASWSKRGMQAVVLINGRNARRVVHGALQTRTGELVRMVRARHRADDSLAFVAALGAVRPEVPKLLLWDNAPPHQPHRVRDAAQAAGITVAFLPFRSPEDRKS